MSFLRRSVNDNFWRASARRRVADAFQLELPLGRESIDPPPLSVIAVEQMRGEEIVKSISSVLPKVIIDTRELPRFDMPGLSRAIIFDAIEMIGATYQQKPLPWSRADLSLSSAYLVGNIYSYAQSARMANGPALLLVSMLDHKRLIESFLDRF